MADEKVYRFEFISDTKEELENGVTDILGSGTQESSKKGKSSKKTFSQAFNQKAEDNAMQAILISPLNTATGGLARPVYRATKRIARGGSVSVAMGTLAVMAIQVGLQALQKRVKDLETKAENLNNTDNALIRAGSISKATYYTANVFGIKQKTNRS